MATAIGAWRHRTAVTLRILGAVFGGYALSAAAVAVAAVALPLWFAVPRGDAALAASMAGFLLYLSVLLWAFAERQVWKVWLVLWGGAAAGSALVQWLSPLLAAIPVNGA